MTYMYVIQVRDCKHRFGFDVCGTVRPPNERWEPMAYLRTYRDLSSNYQA